MIALLYMLRAGCPWRDLPGPIPRRTVYRYFAQWRDDGMWQTILKRLHRRMRGRLFCIDSTYVRVHRSGANPAGGQALQAMGPSRGGLTSKIHAIVDGNAKPVALVLSASNVADTIAAPELIEQINSATCSILVGDKGYDSDPLRIALYERDIFPCLAALSTRVEKRPFHKVFYRHRHRVEYFFCALKSHRRIATRYQKIASSFLAFVSIASILHWRRSALALEVRGLAAGAVSAAFSFPKAIRQCEDTSDLGVADWSDDLHSINGQRPRTPFRWTDSATAAPWSNYEQDCC